MTKHNRRVIERFRRIERWLDGLWIAGLLVVLVVSAWSGTWWLAALTAAWALHDLWGVKAPRQDSADADLPPRDPSFRPPFDPPRLP